MWGGWPTYTLTHTKSKTPKCSNKQTQFTLLLSVRKINLSRCFSLSLLFKKTYCIKTKYTRTKGKTRDLGLLVRCIRFLLDFFLALSLRLDLVCTFNVTNEQKKTRKNQMCAQYTWKPLVERRVHIETNKHITRCMFISSETTNKNKNG